MRTFRLARDQVVLRPVEEVFGFFADARNLEAITPPWLHFHILTPRITMGPGALIDYHLRWRGVPLRWRTRIEEWVENEWFVDAQIRGPYRRWIHHHTFAPVAGGTRMRDELTYALPLGPLGTLMQRLIVGPDLERIFDHRAARIAALMAADDPTRQPSSVE